MPTSWFAVSGGTPTRVMKAMSSGPKSGQRSLTYGEILHSSVENDIIPALDIQDGDNAWDFGSGTGQIVAQIAHHAHFVAGRKNVQVSGIELAPERDAVAQDMYAAFGTVSVEAVEKRCREVVGEEGINFSSSECRSVAEAIVAGLRKLQSFVRFRRGDILTEKYDEATKIFINNTVFEPSLMIPLVKRLAALPKLKTLVVLRTLCARHSSRCEGNNEACRAFAHPPVPGTCNPTWCDETTIFTYAKIGVWSEDAPFEYYPDYVPSASSSSNSISRSTSLVSSPRATGRNGARSGVSSAAASPARPMASLGASFASAAAVSPARIRGPAAAAAAAASSSSMINTGSGDSDAYQLASPAKRMRGTPLASARMSAAAAAGSGPINNAVRAPSPLRSSSSAAARARPSRDSLASAAPTPTAGSSSSSTLAQLPDAFPARTSPTFEDGVDAEAAEAAIAAGSGSGFTPPALSRRRESATAPATAAAASASSSASASPFTSPSKKTSVAAAALAEALQQDSDEEEVVDGGASSGAAPTEAASPPRAVRHNPASAAGNSSTNSLAASLLSPVRRVISAALGMQASPSSQLMPSAASSSKLMVGGDPASPAKLPQSTATATTTPAKNLGTPAKRGRSTSGHGYGSAAVDLFAESDGIASAAGAHATSVGSSPLRKPAHPGRLPPTASSSFPSASAAAHRARSTSSTRRSGAGF